MWRGDGSKTHLYHSRHSPRPVATILRLSQQAISSTSRNMINYYMSIHIYPHFCTICSTRVYCKRVVALRLPLFHNSSHITAFFWRGEAYRDHIQSSSPFQQLKTFLIYFVRIYSNFMLSDQETGSTCLHMPLSTEILKLSSSIIDDIQHYFAQYRFCVATTLKLCTKTGIVMAKACLMWSKT